MESRNRIWSSRRKRTAGFRSETWIWYLNGVKPAQSSLLTTFLTSLMSQIEVYNSLSILRIFLSYPRPYFTICVFVSFCMFAPYPFIWHSPSIKCPRVLYSPTLWKGFNSSKIKSESLNPNSFQKLVCTYIFNFSHYLVSPAHIFQI